MDRSLTGACSSKSRRAKQGDHELEPGEDQQGHWPCWLFVREAKEGRLLSVPPLCLAPLKQMGEKSR